VSTNVSWLNPLFLLLTNILRFFGFQINNTNIIWYIEIAVDISTKYNANHTIYTWSPYKTNGSGNELNVFTPKWRWTSQHGTKNTKKCNWTSWPTRTSLKTRDELRSFVRIGSSFSFSATFVTCVTNPVMSHEWGKGLIMITTNRTIPFIFYLKEI
jgi:hypothetical protein